MGALLSMFRGGHGIRKLQATFGHHQRFRNLSLSQSHAACRRPAALQLAASEQYLCLPLVPLSGRVDGPDGSTVHRYTPRGHEVALVASICVAVGQAAGRQ